LAPFGQAVSEKIFLTLANQKKELILVAMFVGRMEPNVCKVLYTFLHFVPFHQQIWPPRAILVSDWLLFKQIFSSETAWQNVAKLGRKHLCKILYKASSFGSILPTNMATKIGRRTWLFCQQKTYSF
jgi:hypothetical protein